MAFTLVKYELLRKNIISSIKSLAKYYRYFDVTDLINAYLVDKTVDPAIWKQKYSDISEIRRSQAAFLLTVIRCLDEQISSKPEALENCEYLLNAAACYVRDIINQSYDAKASWNNYWASFVTSVDNSKFYNLLGSALLFTRDNLPTNNEASTMYTHLKQFILHQTYENPNNPEQGYLVVDSQKESQVAKTIISSVVFSIERIEGFIVEDFIGELIARIATLEQKVMDSAKKECKSKAEVTKVGIFRPEVATEENRQNKLDDVDHNDPEREHSLFVYCVQ
ncbi:MAG: hypothetical protein P4L79_05400 [Legionella sp.]|uniref:hypothetical protein n=1 Tax=Legionella sp. TaxID=459 RepID=UPI0028437832|nr:hypothetical protein [Legionella sp.]